MSDDLDDFLRNVRDSNASLADKYSMVGARWVDEDNAARLLEETKTVVLEQRKADIILVNPGMADNAAERQAKADPEWHEWVRNMVTAKTRANRLKLALKVIDMRHSEQQSFEATKRAEMKL
jgi:hypothetical protein